MPACVPSHFAANMALRTPNQIASSGELTKPAAPRGAGLLPGPVVVMFSRFGPYHLARLRAAAKAFAVAGVEVSNVDKTYAWSEVREAQGFRREMLFEGRDVAGVSRRELRLRLSAVMGALKPAVVAVPGWSERASLGLLKWGLRNRVPVVMMSDSTKEDKARPWHRRPSNAAWSGFVPRALWPAAAMLIISKAWACLGAGLSRDMTWWITTTSRREQSTPGATNRKCAAAASFRLAIFSARAGSCQPRITRP